MKSISRSRKINLSVAGAIYLLLFLVTAILFYNRGFAGLKSVYILNIGVDLASMLTGYVLYICCLVDIQEAGADYKYYLFLLNTVIGGLFTDAIAWLVDGNPNLRIVNIIDNVSYYSCTAFASCFFWLFIVNFVNSGRKIVKVLSYYVFGGLFISEILILSNLFTDFYFYVDEAGFYHRTDIYIFANIYVYTVLLAALYVAIIERKRMHGFQLGAIVIYVIAPLIVAVLTTDIYGLSINYGCIMIIMLLIYCVINVTQGREKAASDRDMRTASAIQTHILPNTFPAFPERDEFDIYASMDTAKEVGGDFYDYFLVDDDHLALVMADVSGKGVPSALFMMIARTLIKNEMLNGCSPEKALFNVNNRLLDGKTEMFVTVWLALLEISTGKGWAVNAGHEHPAIRHANGEYELVKYKHFPAVSLMENYNYRQHEFKLEKGDSFFVYTDGVTEAVNAEKDFFGEERMLKALNENPDASPKELLDNVSKAIDSFVQGAEQFDDITMMCMKFAND